MDPCSSGLEFTDATGSELDPAGSDLDPANIGIDSLLY